MIIQAIGGNLILFCAVVWGFSYAAAVAINTIWRS
jgi:hypothetical protein